jgi:hypothetical protein
MKKKINWLWVAIGVVASCALLFYLARFFSGYVPLSTLPVEKKLEIEGGIMSVCNGRSLLPPSLEGPDWPFPATSPNGQYYADVGKSSYRNATELRLYEVESNRLLGSYSFKMLYIYCWAEDSSGVYLQDWDRRGGGLLFSFPALDRAPYYSPVKKVMVRR